MKGVARVETTDPIGALLAAILVALGGKPVTVPSEADPSEESASAPPHLPALTAGYRPLEQ